MSETKIYPKGIRTFKPHENAPEFVKGALIITPSELLKFCEENKELMTEYNGTPQLKCQILHGDNGIYITVDTWKKDGANDGANDGASGEPIQGPEDDSLPF